MNQYTSWAGVCRTPMTIWIPILGNKSNDFLWIGWVPITVCEFSHKSDTNGLWNLTYQRSYWLVRIFSAVDYFSCITLISFSVICRDRCDWLKKRVALPSTIYSSGFLRVLLVEIFLFCFHYANWSIWWNIMYRNFWLVKTVKGDK